MRLSHFRARETAIKQRRAVSALLGFLFQCKLTCTLDSMARCSRALSTPGAPADPQASAAAARSSHLLSLLHSEPLPSEREATTAPIACKHPSAAEAHHKRRRPDSQAPAGGRAKALASSSRSGAAAVDAACPVCGLLLPAAQLQAHIQEELALLVDDGSSWPCAGSSTPCAPGAAGTSWQRAAATAEAPNGAERAGPGRSAAATAKPWGGSCAAAPPRPGAHAGSRTGSRAWQAGGVGAAGARHRLARGSARGDRRARSGGVRPLPQGMVHACWLMQCVGQGLQIAPEGASVPDSSFRAEA